VRALLVLSEVAALAEACSALLVRNRKVAASDKAAAPVVAAASGKVAALVVAAASGKVAAPAAAVALVKAAAPAAAAAMAAAALDKAAAPAAAAAMAAVALDKAAAPAVVAEAALRVAAAARNAICSDARSARGASLGALTTASGARRSEPHAFAQLS